MKRATTYTLKLNTFTVEVTRKRMKSIRLRVLPDSQVRLSVPLSLSRAAAESFLLQRQSWVEQQLAALAAAREHAPSSEDTLLLFGCAYPIAARRGAAFALTLEDGRAILTCPAEATPEKREAFLQRYYRAALQREIEARLPLWEAKTGLRCAAFQIRSMRSRWGSCTVKTAHIRFALQLVHYPLPCLDYVILHELCHLSVPNHSAAFKALLTQHMPHWQSQKNRLRQPPAE